MSKPKLIRSFSIAEKDGIKRALETIKRKSIEIEKQGMSPMSFTLGFLNVVISTYILGKCPEHFWLWQSFICSPLFVWVWRYKKKKSEALYMLDLCWIVHLVMCLFSILCLCQLFYLDVKKLVDFRFITANPYVTTALFAMSCGPLGWGVILVGNPLVLHDPAMTASLIIHIIPPILMWSLRWHHNDVSSAYPGLFTSAVEEAVWHDDTDIGVCTQEGYFDLNALGQFMLPPFVMYMVWWTPYTLWLLIWGIKHSPTSTGQRTVWSETLRNNTTVCKLLLGTATSTDTVHPVPALVYMIAHAVFSHLMFVFSYLCFHYYSLHSSFIVFLFLYSVYAGSVRYYKMTTKWYSRAVEELIQSNAE